MTIESDSAEIWGLLNRQFSTSRMRPYLEHAKGDMNRAIELFEWNLDASIQIWKLVCLLEVSIRNALDFQLERFAKESGYKRSWIFDAFGILKGSQGQSSLFRSLSVTMNRLEKSKKEVNKDNVVAGLNLEFWCNLVSKRYMNLWPTLSYAFRNAPQRSQLNVSEPLRDLLNMRNRIAHHDRIWNLNLEYYLESMCNLAAFIDWELYDLILPMTRTIKSDERKMKRVFEYSR